MSQSGFDPIKLTQTVHVSHIYLAQPTQASMSAILLYRIFHFIPATAQTIANTQSDFQWHSRWHIRKRLSFLFESGLVYVNFVDVTTAITIMPNQHYISEENGKITVYALAAHSDPIVNIYKSARKSERLLTMHAGQFADKMNLQSINLQTGWLVE